MQKKWFALSCFVVGSIILAIPVFQSMWSLRRAVAFMDEIPFVNSTDKVATSTQKFKPLESGKFKVSWVEPWEYKGNPNLDSLNYTYELSENGKILGNGSGKFDLRNPLGQSVDLERNEEYSVALMVQGPNAKETLKGFQLKVAADQESILAEASASFRILSMISIALFALGYWLIRKVD